MVSSFSFLFFLIEKVARVILIGKFLEKNKFYYYTVLRDRNNFAPHSTAQTHGASTYVFNVF